MTEVRPARPGDVAPWARLRAALWPDEDPAELASEARTLLERGDGVAVHLAVVDARIAGFAEWSLHAEAPGCSTSPVGYLEAWYVEPASRGRGLGRRLVEAGIAWARARGCAEVASDTTPEYPGSPAAHRALGFEPVGQSLRFRRALEAAASPPPDRLPPTSAFGTMSRIPGGTTMDAISQIGIDEAKKLLDAGEAVFIDIRDPMSFEGGHVPGARHVGDHNIREFVASTDKDATIVAYCYHGNSSQGAAAWLMEQGFSAVHSMAGGFEMWKTAYGSETAD